MNRTSVDTDFVVVVPAFNEEDHISPVVQKLRQDFPVLVIDDGSTDHTAKLAESWGAYVIQKTKNHGYDAAIKSGISWAIQNKFKFAITIDADGQIAPFYANEVKKMLESGTELVVGKRQRYARWSEYIFSRYTKLAWGIHDPLCGLKGYKLSRLSLEATEFEFDSVGTSWMTFLYKSDKKPITQEIEIQIRPRSSESRFGNSIKAEFSILRALIHTVTAMKPSK